MKITVLAVGKVRGPLEAAVAEFEARASRYWKLEVVEVDAGAGRGARGDPDAVRRSEADRITERLRASAATWALTRKGKSLTSMDLARALSKRMVEATGDLGLVIGGAFGLHETLLDRADLRLALSGMTLPHEMARLVLAEQLYRAGTILRKEPYHKGEG